MRRRKLLQAALSGLVAAAAPPKAAAAEVGSVEYARKLLQFNEHYGTFFRDYFGCPLHASTTEECTLGSGHTNYDAYLKASRLVKEVFPQP